VWRGYQWAGEKETAVKFVKKGGTAGKDGKINVDFREKSKSAYWTIVESWCKMKRSMW
jgi:hypothetical protein